MSLVDDLQDALDELEEAEDLVDDAPGPLPLTVRILVTVNLTVTELRCNAALASLQVSGSPGQDENTYPTVANLPGIAADCTMLAAYAQDEAIDHTTGWQHRCASHLVTIKRLITMEDGYRDRAGIT